MSSATGTTLGSAFRDVIADSGVLGLWRGLTAGLLRQIFYGTARFGIFQTLSVSPHVQLKVVHTRERERERESEVVAERRSKETGRQTNTKERQIDMGKETGKATLTSRRSNPGETDAEKSREGKGLRLSR